MMLHKHSKVDRLWLPLESSIPIGSVYSAWLLWAYVVLIIANRVMLFGRTTLHVINYVANYMDCVKSEKILDSQLCEKCEAFCLHLH